MPITLRSNYWEDRISASACSADGGAYFGQTGDSEDRELFPAGNLALLRKMKEAYFHTSASNRQQSAIGGPLKPRQSSSAERITKKKKNTQKTSKVWQVLSFSSKGQTDSLQITA